MKVVVSPAKVAPPNQQTVSVMAFTVAFTRELTSGVENQIVLEVVGIDTLGVGRTRDVSVDHHNRVFGVVVDRTAASEVSVCAHKRDGGLDGDLSHLKGLAGRALGRIVSPALLCGTFKLTHMRPTDVNEILSNATGLKVGRTDYEKTRQ